MGSSIKTTLFEIIEDLDLRCCFNSCRPSKEQHQLQRDSQTQPIQTERGNSYSERPLYISRRYSDRARPNPHPLSDDSHREGTRDQAIQTGNQHFYDPQEREKIESDIITVQRVNQGTQTSEPPLPNSVEEQEDFRLSYRPLRPHYKETIVHEPLPKHQAHFSRGPPPITEFVRTSQPFTTKEDIIVHPHSEGRILNSESELNRSYRHAVDNNNRQFIERTAPGPLYEMNERSERDRHYGYGSDDYSNNETRHNRSVWANERERSGKYTPWCIAVGFVIALCSIGIPLLLIGAILIFVGDGNSATYKAGLALLIIASIMAIVGIAIIILLYSGFCGKKPNSVFRTKRSRFHDPPTGPRASNSIQVERYPQPLRPTYPADEPSYRSYYRGDNYDHRSPEQGNWSQNNRKAHSNYLTDGNESFQDFEETEQKTIRDSATSYETRRDRIREAYGVDGSGRGRIRSSSSSPHHGRFVIQEQPHPRAVHPKPVTVERHKPPPRPQRTRMMHEERYDYGPPWSESRPYDQNSRSLYPDEPDYNPRPRQVVYENISQDESRPQSPKPEPERVKSQKENETPARPTSISRSTERPRKKKEKKKPRHKSVKLEDPKEEEIGGIPVSKKKKNRQHHARFRNNRGHPYAWDKLPQTSPQKATVKKKKVVSGPLRDRYYNDDDTSTESDSPLAYEPGTHNAYPWYVDGEKIKPKPSKKEQLEIGAKRAWEEGVKNLPDRVYNYHNYLRNVLGNVQWPSRDRSRSYPEPKPPAGEHPLTHSRDSKAENRSKDSGERFFPEDLIANSIGRPKVAGRRLPFDSDDMMRKLC